ncbi:hypothetical protein B0J14DRAFT_572430 [Halenospora varia]|nr:hypothetical protein B0J14DRAFT_572430 [Halenospora varia]
MNYISGAYERAKALQIGKDPDAEQDSTIVAKAIIQYYDEEPDGKDRIYNPRLKSLMPKNEKNDAKEKMRDATQGKSRQASRPAYGQFASTTLGGGQNQETSTAKGSGFNGLFDKPRPVIGDRSQSADRPLYNNSPLPTGRNPPAAMKGASVKLNRGPTRPDSARSASSQNTAQPMMQRSYGSSRSGGGGNYEDSFAPDGGYGGYSNGSSRNDKPVMSANTPWSSTQDEFSGYDAGYGVGQSGGGRPTPGSRGPGLPSGPRGKRF